MTIKIGVTKFDTFNEFGDLETLDTARIQALHILARMPFPKGYFVTAQVAPMLAEYQVYVGRCLQEIEPAYKLGCRHFDIHYYQNTQAGGAGWAWYNGIQFSKWWIKVIEMLRTHYPDCKFGYPKLEIGNDIPKYRYGSELFEQQSCSAIEIADYIAMLVYFRSGRNDWGDLYNAIYHVRSMVLLYNKPVQVTFMNKNNNVPKTIKGEQYLEFYRQMHLTPNVTAAYCHTLSSSYELDTWATWRSAAHPSTIPEIIGARDF